MSTATFVPTGTAATIVTSKPTTGEIITPTIPGTGLRVVMLVSPADHAKVTRLGSRSVRVTDLLTGYAHRLVADDCGLGCRCAVTFAKEGST